MLISVAAGRSCTCPLIHCVRARETGKEKMKRETGRASLATKNGAAEAFVSLALGSRRRAIAASI